MGIIGVLATLALFWTIDFIERVEPPVVIPQIEQDISAIRTDMAKVREIVERLDREGVSVELGTDGN